jgi:spoIIIJ-associated protein
MLEEQAEVAAEFLAGVLERMGVRAEVERHLVDGIMYVDVGAPEDPEDMGRLIGRHGQTLEALQEVVRGAVQRKTSGKPLVVVDVEDYRKRRRAQLVDRARELAEKVRSTGKRHRMEPMNAFERKIVHDAVSSVGGVESISEGEDPQRRVVLHPRGR